MNLTSSNFLQGQNFLGHGFNAVYANPIVSANGSGGAPEGLTKAQSILAFFPSERTVKWNGNEYVCPLGVDCDVYNSCGASTSSFSAHGAKSMQESLKVNVDVSTGGWFPGSFTASASYEDTVSSMEENSYHYFYAEAMCAMYHLKLQAFTHETRVTQAFKNGIEYLDVEDEGTFFEVIEAFGTHYTSSIMIGGQYTKYDYFSEEYYETASSNGFNFEAMAEVSFVIASGSASVSVEKQKECKTEYDEKAEGGSSYYVGGAAFEGSSSDWYQGLVDDESVAPIGKNIEITPIYKLMTRTYFPGDESIVEKATMMKEKLQTYCRWLGENGKTCIEEPEDKIPPVQVKMTELEGGPNNRYAAEVAIGAYVYRFGGYDDYYNVLKTTSKYDAVMGEWDDAAVQELPEALRGVCAAAIGTDIYIFGGYKRGNDDVNTVRKYDTTRDAYAVVAPMDHTADGSTDFRMSAATVTLDDGSQNIFYGGCSSTGVYTYDPVADTHTNINDDLKVFCLATSHNGKELFGISREDQKLYKIDINTGSATKFSEDIFPGSNGAQCAMATDNNFYMLNINNEIYYMETSADSDKRTYKSGSIPDHHDRLFSAVMIQDAILITSKGYTDAIDTRPEANAKQLLLDAEDATIY